MGPTCPVCSPPGDSGDRPFPPFLGLLGRRRARARGGALDLACSSTSRVPSPLARSSLRLARICQAKARDFSKGQTQSPSSRDKAPICNDVVQTIAIRHRPGPFGNRRRRVFRRFLEEGVRLASREAVSFIKKIRRPKILSIYFNSHSGPSSGKLSRLQAGLSARG